MDQCKGKLAAAADVFYQAKTSWIIGSEVNDGLAKWVSMCKAVLHVQK